MTPLYCHLGQIVSDTTERNDEIPSSKVVKETETTDPQAFCSEDTLKGHTILVTPQSSEREGEKKIDQSVSKTSLHKLLSIYLSSPSTTKTW